MKREPGTVSCSASSLAGVLSSAARNTSNGAPFLICA
ncbi:Uncharacterised protein [Bordetella pertussis]|nr:Uncharacterised protein [Bordetella pertussis]